MINKLIKIVPFLIIFLSLTACTNMAPLNTKGSPKSVGGTYDPQLSEAMLAYQEGRLSSAETLFLQYVNKRPKYTEAWFKLGNIYYRTGQYPAAITAYENVIQQSPKNGKAWHNLALTRVKQAEMTLMKAESLLEAGDPQKRQVTALKNKIRGGVRQPTPAGALNKYSVPAKQKQQKVKPQNKKKKVVTKKKYTKSTRGSIKNKQINKETPNKNKLSSSSNYWNNIARQLSIK